MRINAIDLRQLRYFVTVAEELHFGRAAKRLNISQPPLSQQIKALEAHMGVQLFARTQRHVELTPAGTYLLPEARKLLNEMNRVALQTKEAEAGLTGHLRVGVNFSAPFHPFTTKLLQKFHQLYPWIRVELVLHEQANLLQLADIKAAQLDLALIWLDDGHQHADLERLNLAHDLLMAVVPAKHQLAKQKTIHIRDLVGELLIGQSRHAGTQCYDAVIEAFAAVKAEPRRAYEIMQMPLVLSMVAAGQGISLLPGFLAKLPIEGAVFRPLGMPKGKRTPCMTYNLIAPIQGRSAAASNFFILAKQLSKG